MVCPQHEVGCMTDRDRLLSKVFFEPNSGCWLWEASLLKDGYPQFYFNGQNRRATRVSYDLFVGKIPDGMQVCHKCDVPTCVNPDHLFVGTQKENIAYCRTKGRIYKKLSKEVIFDIRAALANGIAQKAIAQAFGVCQATISFINTGRGARGLQVYPVEAVV